MPGTLLGTTGTTTTGGLTGGTTTGGTTTGGLPAAAVVTLSVMAGPEPLAFSAATVTVYAVLALSPENLTCRSRGVCLEWMPGFSVAV